MSEAELHEVLRLAISRASQDEPENGLSLDDALEIARHLDIPEEHVHAAAEALSRQKQLAAGRRQIRARRGAACAAGLALLALVVLFAFLIGFGPATTASLAIAGFAVVGLAWYAWRGPVADADAENAAG